MSNQADLMAVLRAIQQAIERLQAAVDNQPPNKQHVTGTRKQPVKPQLNLNFHEEPGTSKTPERIQVEDGQSDDEQRNPRSRRQEESSYEAHSTRRDSYEHRVERYTSAPVIVGRPFTEEVDHFPTSQNFKMPPCESYDSTGDPMEHLARFTSAMNLHLVPDQIMCRAFPVTLKGAAHVWFQHLAPRSISCWAQLAKSFRNNFLTSRIQRKNSSALFRIVQGPKESLKSYYARFNTEKLLIDNLDSRVTFAAMARASREHTLNQIKGQDILKWPKPMRMPTDRRDAQVYCQFHKDHGHTTEECKVLRREIENLIARGHLKQFVKTNERQGDLEEVITPHDDSLVISLQIDAYVIKRILVDTGSSADILFEEAFSQIKISRERIRPISTPLYGFMGASASVEGVIPLTVVAGSYPLQATQSIDFLSAERCLPFFKALKNIKNFEWTAECQNSFEASKEYLTAPPLLSKPLVGEELFLYLAIAESAVSEVLVRNQNSKQLPIYYVSKVLQGAELHYPDTEKLAFALLIIARKLRPYFQPHSITVLTDKPLRRILHKPNVSGQLVPWSIELREFDIHYKPRPSIKGHALTDFIVECTLPIEDEEQLPQQEGFGIPRVLVTDNGRQFDNHTFHAFCANLSIEQRFTFVAHPQTNSQTEVTNRTLLQGLKKKLDGAKGLWVDELHKILLAYRTATRNPTGETPFNLAFGTEALISSEIGLPSLHLVTYDPNMNSEALRCNLDLLDEQRDQAQLRLAAYQQCVARYHDRHIHPRAFRIGDLVLRRVEASTPRDAIGKLSPNWEGPYRVTKYGGPGSYHLEHLDGKSIPRTWNATNLRRYYA
ncbi:hypothetical protein RJ639_016151 [Escallonia herrerae]|uniref:Integrase catalytic domain-containing protein n=1 Tax=Escallonia herrerae TaxID=1293975 RepID=A0AA88VEA4_9ASTE|nr:hypothetical protein RJ639_016151 [Escallonia herrerae]